MRIIWYHSVLIPFFFGCVLSFVTLYSQWSWIFLFIIPGIFRLACCESGYRDACIRGWSAGFGYFFIGLFWIGESVLVYHYSTKLYLLTVIAIPAVISLYWSLLFLLFKYLSNALHCNRMVAYKSFVQALLFAYSWGGIEGLRGSITWLKFPWMLIGYGWIDTPISQIFSIFGVYISGVITVFCFSAMLPLFEFIYKLSTIRLRDAFYLYRSQRSTDQNITETCISRHLYPSITISILSIGVIACLWLWGGYRVVYYDQLRDGKDINIGEDRDSTGSTNVYVRIVQPNIPQADKWKQENIPHILGKLYQLSKNPSLHPIDVIVWPEASVPVMIDKVLARKIFDILGAPALVLGSMRMEGDFTRNDVSYYNSMYTILHGEVSDVYDKEDLVPFGEYIPFLSVFNISDRLGLKGFFTITPSRKVVTRYAVKLDEDISFLPLICYEAIFPSNMIVDSKYDFMLNITNDAWFGNSRGLRQHYQHARGRAIEQGASLVRATNTGISGVIDPVGRDMVSSSKNVSAVIDIYVPPRISSTVYKKYIESNIRELVIVSVICLLCIIIMISRINNNTSGFLKRYCKRID